MWVESVWQVGTGLCDVIWEVGETVVEGVESCFVRVLVVGVFVVVGDGSRLWRGVQVGG